MNEAAKVMIPSLLIAIVLFMLYTGRKARKFETSHQTVIFKTKGIIRGLESLFLLLFGAAALLMLKDAIDPVTGFILMAVTFICWLPLQALLYTMLSLDEQGMAYMNPLRRAIEITWQDVISVSASSSGILIKSGDEIIRIRSFFSGLDKIKGIIKENCPKAFDES